MSVVAQQVLTASDPDVLEYPSILPGFSCSVAELFA